VICGFSLRIPWSSRIVKSTISRPREILVAFIKATFPGELCIDPSPSLLRARSLQAAWAYRSLAEKPKMGELQMDWLRSEDLKEEKNVTTPIAIIANERRLHFSVAKMLAATQSQRGTFLAPRIGNRVHLLKPPQSLLTA
jgi:hypothetical protein